MINFLIKGANTKKNFFEGIKGELHHHYRHGDYSFSHEEYCKTSFLKGANNIAIFPVQAKIMA